jgi:hypothetical protein
VWVNVAFYHATRPIKGVRWRLYAYPFYASHTICCCCCQVTTVTLYQEEPNDSLRYFFFGFYSLKSRGLICLLRQRFLTERKSRIKLWTNHCVISGPPQMGK